MTRRLRILHPCLKKIRLFPESLTARHWRFLHKKRRKASYFRRGYKLVLRCCKRDGGRTSEVALQGEASNHLKLLGLKAPVASVEEKSHWMRQV